jgi:hypothetical protein
LRRMKPGLSVDLPAIGGGAVLGRAIFKYYAHGFGTDAGPRMIPRQLCSYASSFPIAFATLR